MPPAAEVAMTSRMLGAARIAYARPSRRVWTIATPARANPVTAAMVCTASCGAAAALNGIGQPVVQGTAAPTANIALAPMRLVLTAHAPNSPRPLRIPQSPIAEAAPPSATRPSERLNAVEVISPAAPSPLT